MLARLLLVAILSCLGAATARAQLPGTAYVVDRFGLHAEGNSFERLDAVFLAGGRGPTCTGPGLADGDYYFQVTDPAGTVLLSSDPVAERKVRVIGGQFAQYLGSTHLNSTKGPCGTLFVRLLPFLPSPYPLQDYKVWVTRVQDYDPRSTQLFGFDPGLCKSDTFRIQNLQPQSIVRGHKFYDFNGNGAWNPAAATPELPVGGWRVELWRNGVLDGLTFTDQDGVYAFVRDRDGSTYEVREVSPNGFVNDGTPGATWRATTPRSGTVVTALEIVAGPEFGNVHYELLPTSGRSVDFWSDTTCTCGEVQQQVVVDPSCSLSILAFCDPTWRLALNTWKGLPVALRNPVSNDNPAASIFSLNLPPQSVCGAYANWKSFAGKKPHDHAGFLLSRQVAATLLNRSCGFMQGEIYVDRFQDGVLVSLTDMLDGAIGLLRQTGAGLTGPNDPYQDLRLMMVMCTNEFGRINETGDPTAPQVVYRSSEIPPRVAAPY